MRHVRHGELDNGDFARLERLGFRHAVAEFAAERFAAHQLLVATHPHAGRVRFRIRKIVGVDVDQLHDPVRVGAGGAHMQFDFDRPRDVHILLQHIPLVDEHIGAAPGEALVGGHIFIVHADDSFLHIRHGLGRVGYELVESLRLALGQRERLIGREMQLHLLGFLRGPSVEAPPAVRAGLEHQRGLRQRRDFCLFQMALEERVLDILAVVLARLGVELHRPERIAVAARPTAVDPRPHDEYILRAVGA